MNRKFRIAPATAPESGRNLAARRRNIALTRRMFYACAALYAPFLSAQEPDAPLGLDAAVAYARQHSPRLSAKKLGVKTEEAAVAEARAERLPRFTLGAAARVSSQPVQTAMGFPLSQLADIPGNQAFSRGHLNADVEATLPLYTGGRIASAVRLAQAERDLAHVGVQDVDGRLGL